MKKKSLHLFARENIKEYGQYTIEERALPDYRDGLKPVHRRILWSMYKTGFFSSGNTKKCARVVGHTMGSYHPHGDTILYGSLVNMVNLPKPLIFGQGNFGFFDDGAAAPRYTECKLNKYSEQVLLDPKYLAVTPMVVNYDGTETEPVYLPALIPNLLLNGSVGIAVGITVGVPQFETKSILKLIKLGFDRKTITPKIAKKYLQPITIFNSQLNENDSTLLEYYKTGSGKAVFEPIFELSKNQIIVTSLSVFSYGYSKINVLEKIRELDGVKSLDDFSDKELKPSKIKIIISLKPLETKEHTDLVNKIKKILTNSFALHTNLTERMPDGSPKFFSTTIPDMLNKWIAWRIQLELDAQKFIKQNLEKQIHFHELLSFACDKLEIIFKILKSKSDTLDKDLSKALKISIEDAGTILSLQVRRLSKLSQAKEKATIAELKVKLAKAIKIIKNPEQGCLENLANLEKLFVKE